MDYYSEFFDKTDNSIDEVIRAVNWINEGNPFTIKATLMAVLSADKVNRSRTPSRVPHG